MDFRKRFPLRLGRPGVDEQVDAELDFHLAMRRRELIEGGMSDAQAQQAALERFGDYVRARRECRAIGHQRERQMRILQYLYELRQDAAFSVRQMFAAPAFTFVTVATLALGIGATTAIFSAVHAVVLRPLPVEEPARIVTVNAGWRGVGSNMAAAHYLHLAANQTAFEALGAMQRDSFTLAREQGAERVVGARVTGGYFDVFRVRPAAGRVFSTLEDQPGREQVVVLSHRLWARQFQADWGIVGRDIHLNDRPYTVLGVMPASFDFTPNQEELWVPIAFSEEQKATRGEHYLTVFARLRDDVPIERADSEMAAIVQRRRELWPDESTERTLGVSPLMDRFVGDYRQRLLVLFGAVALVLAIACGNVSNLLLARGASRARELAVRSALGAGQGRLVRQLFTESLVLGLVAAAAGIALAQWLIRMLITFSPPGVPRLEQAGIDPVALAFAAALAPAASTASGLVPAWRASRADVNSTLKEAGRGAGSRTARDVVRSTLIAAEVALTLVLLVGAGLLIRSALEMQRIHPGFEPEGLFSGRFLLSETKYAHPASLLRVATDIEASVARIPGVKSVALASTIPSLRSFSNGLLPEGKVLDLRNITQADGVFVSTNYFRTMQTRIVQGRSFTQADDADSPLVVMLNETAAKQMWPGENALGKRLTSANPRGPTTVVGIAADVRLGGPSETAPPTFYVPLAQMEDTAWRWTRRALFLVARSNADPAALGPSVRRVIASLDPAVPLFSVQTMKDRMRATTETARFNTIVLSILGGMGLILAAIGIYGVIAYFATQRTSEIGIRLALGASRTDVIRLVVRQAARPVLAGLAAGTLGAAFASSLIASQLVNVQHTDPLTFAAVAAGMLLVALLAAFIPARRAARLDPTRALHAG